MAEWQVGLVQHWQQDEGRQQKSTCRLHMTRSTQPHAQAGKIPGDKLRMRLAVDRVPRERGPTVIRLGKTGKPVLHLKA